MEQVKSFKIALNENLKTNNGYTGWCTCFHVVDYGFDDTMHTMVYKYKELNDITPMALMTGVINIENRYHSILVEDTNDILLTKDYVQFNEKEIAL